MAEKHILQIVLDVNGKSAKGNIKSVIDSLKKEFNKDLKINIDFPNSKSVSNRLGRMTRRLQTFNTELERLAKFSGGAAAGIHKIALATGVASDEMQNLNKSSVQAQKVIQGTASVIQQGASAMERLGAQTALTTRRYAGFVVASRFVFGFERSLEEAVSGAIDFNTQLVKVAQVSKLPAASIDRLRDQIRGLSVDFAAPADELAKAAVTISQAGFSFRETQRILGEIAPTNLAPTFGEISGTVDGLIAILNQFNIEATKSGDVLDTLNALAAKFPTEVSDLFEIVKRSGAAFSAASGVQDGVKDSVAAFRELSAVGTAVRSSTRLNASQIGTSLKTIFTRIQKPEVIEDLRQLQIELRNSNKEFIGPIEALKAIDERLQGVSTRSAVFQRVVQNLGGLRQADKTIALLTNLTTILDALDTAQASKGSVLADAGVAVKDLGIQLQSLRQDFNRLIGEIVSSGSFQTIVGTFVSFGKAVIQAARVIEPIAPVLAGIFGTKAAFGLGAFLKGFANNIKYVNANTQALAKNTQGLLTLTRNLGFRGLPIPGSIPRRANGGPIRGPGGSKQDNILAAVSNGEYVISADAVRKVGLPFLNAVNAGSLPKFASGGPTSRVVTGLNKQFGTNLRLIEGELTSFERTLQRIGKAIGADVQFLTGDRNTASGSRIRGFTEKRSGAIGLVRTGDRKALFSTFIDELSHAVGADASNAIRQRIAPQVFNRAADIRGARGRAVRHEAQAAALAGFAASDPSLLGDLKEVTKSKNVARNRNVILSRLTRLADTGTRNPDEFFLPNKRASEINKVPGRRGAGALLRSTLSSSDIKRFESLQKQGIRDLSLYLGGIKEATSVVNNVTRTVNSLDELEVVVNDTISTAKKKYKSYGVTGPGVAGFLGKTAPAKNPAFGPVSPFGNTINTGSRTGGLYDKLLKRGYSPERAAELASISSSRQKAGDRLSSKFRRGGNAALNKVNRLRGTNNPALAGKIGAGSFAASLLLGSIQTEAGSTSSILQRAGLGAATGAGLGSFIPGVGTAVGAGVGAVIGGGIGLASGFGERSEIEAAKRLDLFAKALEGARSSVERNAIFGRLFEEQLDKVDSTFFQSNRKDVAREAFGNVEDSIGSFADTLSKRALKSGAGSLEEFVNNLDATGPELRGISDLLRLAKEAGVDLDLHKIVDEKISSQKQQIAQSLSTSISDVVNTVLVRELDSLSKTIAQTSASIDSFNEDVRIAAKEGLGDFSSQFKQVSIGTGSFAEIAKTFPNITTTVPGQLLSGRDLVDSGLNKILLSNAFGNPNDLDKSIGTITGDARIPATVRNLLKSQTDNALKGLDDATPQERFEALSGVLTDFLNNPAFEAAQRSVEQYVALLNKQNAAISQNINSYLQLVQAQRQSNLDALNIRIGSRDFTRRFTSRFDDKRGDVARARIDDQNRFRTLFPNVGSNDSTFIGAQIAAEKSRLETLQQNPAANAALIRASNDKLSQLVGALKFNRDSVNELTAIEGRLVEINQNRENAVNFARQIATADPAARARINQQIGNIQRFEAGGELTAAQTASALEFLDALSKLDDSVLAQFGRSREDIGRLTEGIIARRFSKVTSGGEPILGAFANGPGGDKESQDLLRRAQGINGNRAGAAEQLGKLAQNRITEINELLNKQLKAFESQANLINQQANNLNKLELISQRFASIPKEIEIKSNGISIDVNLNNGQILDRLDPFIRGIVTDQINAAINLQNKRDGDIVNGK